MEGTSFFEYSITFGTSVCMFRIESDQKRVPVRNFFFSIGMIRSLFEEEKHSRDLPCNRICCAYENLIFVILM